jgi:hypothetical protein
MNRKLGIIIVVSGILVLSVGKVRAQEPPPPPPPDTVTMEAEPGGDVMFGPAGARIELLGFAGMHGGKVVTGAPFSAVAVSETTQTLADGNHIAQKSQTNLFRDSQGRFRRETTLPAIGPLATSGQSKSFVLISDPVTNQNLVLHPDTKIAEKLGKRSGRMRGPSKNMMGYWKELSTGDAGFKTEDLGTQVIAGVSAQGTRHTRTIPAGQIGNEKPITIVSERWYSNDLQMVVMTKRSDPRFGDTTYTLTNIQRQEPAASLFTVPADYTVQEGGMGHHGLRKFTQLPPPPPAPND